MLWVLLIAVGGGTAGLLINLNSGIKVLLFFVGSVLTVLIFLSTFAINIEIARLFAKLKKEAEKNGGS